MAGNVEPFYDGDKRMEKLINDLDSVIDDACDKGYTIASVIGCLDIVKAKMLYEIVSDEH